MAPIFASRCVVRIGEGRATARGRVAVDPDADELRVPFDEPRRDPVVTRERDHHAPEIAHVAANVAAIGLQIEDGVGHELSGRVVGDVAAAAGLEVVDPEGARALLRSRGRSARGRRGRG